MKTHSIKWALSVLVIITATLAADGENASYPPNGKQYRTAVTDDMLARVPKWKKDADNSPLAARKAHAGAVQGR